MLDIQDLLYLFSEEVEEYISGEIFHISLQNTVYSFQNSSLILMMFQHLQAIKLSSSQCKDNSSFTGILIHLSSSCKSHEALRDKTKSSQHTSPFYPRLGVGHANRLELKRSILLPDTDIQK